MEASNAPRHPLGPTVTISYEGRKVVRSLARVRGQNQLVLEADACGLMPNMIVGVQVEAANGTVGVKSARLPAVVLSVDKDVMILELECPNRVALQILARYQGEER